MNITHESLLDPLNPIVHGPSSKTTRGAHWCSMCRDWVATQPEPDAVFVAKLAPKVAHYLKHGHDKESA